MTVKNSDDISRIACIGAGTIGSGWTALFLAHGFDVQAWDPAQGFEKRLIERVAAAWPNLERLGLAEGASPQRLTIAPSLEAALEQVDFVQESAPDNEPLKMDLLARIDAHVPAEVIISSSSSKFLPSRLASRCRHPGRIIVGHPFVPAQLVPLVEVVGGADTPAEVLDAAAAFYTRAGKKALKLKKEIEAYVANRLQAVVFKEALALVEAGVCDYEDIDKAVNWGPGIRWPIVGPVLHRHLGGGDGGVRHMIDHFGWSGKPGGEQAFIEAVEARWGHQTISELEAWRDHNLMVMLEGFEPEP